MHARWKALGSSLKTALWWTPVALTINDCIVGGATINGYSMQPTLNLGERSCKAHE
jgi:signal peptidase I